MTKKIYQTVEKKQLLIILPFVCHLSFETRNILNTCVRNQLPSRSLKIAFQSKTLLSSLFHSIPNYLCLHLIFKFSCSCCNATYYGETERHLFVGTSEHLVMNPMTQKRVKNHKSAIMDHILLEGHNVTFEDFSILIPKSNSSELSRIFSTP